ncbi:MAG TPA: tripartite tricarboxylate transporter substrate binding protein [Xanthobacteraceae bacterium]
MKSRVGTALRAFAHPTFAFAVLAALATPATAQDYPTRPIRALTATGAGGTSDIFMRLIGEEMQKHWGQPIIVENRPGGAMTIGGRACAEAPHDGYTVCILPVETLAYNQFLFKKIPYDPEKDFEPITNPFFNTQVLVASAALGVKTLADLAALSKRQPGTLSYAVPSVSLTVFMDKWKAETGADLVRVPFRGGAEAVNGVLTGATPVAFFGLANWIPHIRNGTVRALAIDAAQRSPLFPDVPTLAELGYGKNLTRVYFGIVAPAGTPQPIIHKLSDEIARIGSDPEFRRKRLIEMGLEPVFSTPEEFGKFLIDDRATSLRVVKESGLQPQ